MHLFLAAIPDGRSAGQLALIARLIGIVKCLNMIQESKKLTLN
jgi:hypothetical protein